MIKQSSDDKMINANEQDKETSKKQDNGLSERQLHRQIITALMFN
jgi:hypothetical protein